MGGLEVNVVGPDAVEADVVALPVAEPASPFSPVAASLDARLRGRLARLADDGELCSEIGGTTVVHLNGELRARQVVAAGVGPRERVDADVLRTAAAAVARAARRGGAIAWLLDDSLPPPATEQVRALVDGTILGAYDPGAWKTSGSRRLPLERLAIAALDEELAPVAARTAGVAAWVNRARDLANRPPNDLTPARLANRAEEIAAGFDSLSAEWLGPEEIQAHGMGAFAAVAQGSHNPARLIVMRHEPPEPGRPDLVLGLVGKAITFDTGGISLKPSLYMEDMKGDMAGGAAVIEGMGALAELGVSVRVLAVVAATENMVGGGAYRPGDIVTAMNGKTIEVINTDAEGRLVLADALWHARQQGATHLLDLATLTGAMELALGDLFAGVFGNDDAWRDAVCEAGEASGDHAWPFPLHPRYRRYVDSNFADLKNSSILKQASPALAAEFLKEFVGEGPWAHVDMAGTGFLTRSRGDYLSQRGGTGYGVRLIVELAERLGFAEPLR